MSESLLDVKDLKTHFATDTGLVRAVDGVDLSIESGGILGLVGESGSGKSVTGLSIMGLLGSKRARHAGGQILFKGQDLLELNDRQMRKLRGSEIGMVFQGALTGLDSSFKIESQLVEVIQRHQKVSKTEARRIALESLDIVAMPDPMRKIKSYPHELSGGQRQRVLIAMALACKPQLLIADEPTTALDATVQKQIVDLLVDINRKLGTAILMITHDFGVVARMCHEVAVMRHGKVVESGSVEDVLEQPKHDYTKALMRAVPRLHLERDQRSVPRAERRLFDLSMAFGDTSTKLSPSKIAAVRDRRQSVDFPMIRVEGLRKEYPMAKKLGKGREVFVAVEGATFDIHRGETWGLIGESGSGKTTIGRMMLSLIDPTAGSILFEGNEVATLDRALDKTFQRQRRKRMQMVFQDSGSAFNPRKPVGDQIGFGLTQFDLCAKGEVRGRVLGLLERVGLDEEHFSRYAHEFSGGQKQRLGIARALASEPDFLVLDEPTAALDVSVQAQILNLLKDLQAERDLTMLLITHNLSLVEFMCERTAVLNHGVIVESGDVDEVFTSPSSDITKKLLDAVLEPDVDRAA